ncbi:acetylpolyamine amidohydrolase AphB [Ramlibacter solisilvae]|uniref:Acetylpolyamine aminohydrolase n=1 Tax=Ramlibacter tataouinensis TaxID=94132 RepID=A0A127JRM3_9BURK|nr:histone deacetylase family protein [Ramlibacter tataouinensis]AMO22621.1 acetylpolyamine aminohydrolase [Ramlibacter tataouinensis]
MLILQNDRHREHAGRHEMYRGRLVECVEVPERAELVLGELHRRGFARVERPAVRADMTVVESVHDLRYLAFLRQAWDHWIALDSANASFDILPSVWPNQGLRRDAPTQNFSAQVGRYAFDAGSPITRGTWDACLAGAASAIEAARRVASGSERGALVVTRPPGHHAGRDFFGGYCFLNNAALAAQTLRDAGHARVAILDVDYHHGNGTQSIFYRRADVLTVSIHGDPATEYPFYLGYADERGEGEGEGFNLNRPLPKGTAFDAWRRELDIALEAVARFGASALVVALGVDAYKADPISGFLLDSADFTTIGSLIASARLPTVFVLEGGYAVAEMGINVANVAEGFSLAG